MTKQLDDEDAFSRRARWIELANASAGKVHVELEAPKVYPQFKFRPDWRHSCYKNLSDWFKKWAVWIDWELYQEGYLQRSSVKEPSPDDGWEE